MSHLRLAGDIVLLSESAEQLKKMIEELQSESFAVGIKVHMNIYTVMINKYAEIVFFSIGNETLEQVKEYKYLGQMVSADPNHEKQIRRRIGFGWGALANNALAMDSQIIKSSLPVSLKTKVSNQCILPVMTYAAEIWRLT